ncbi:MAG: HAD-IA family hydrolase, partial [Candidatus Cloacimonetes bacterium]|nr:HAD-IA family hydrolase [Candidatus Cloacimonadota bacterium]
LEYTATIPQGIVSQNSRQNIIRILKKNKIDQFFTSIIGYEEVDLHHQKPHPEGILNCLHEINITEGNVFYVGDHETDINTAKNAAPELKMQASSIEILTIAAYYGSSDDPVYWQTQPDFVASKVADFNKLIDFKKDK